MGRVQEMSLSAVQRAGRRRTEQEVRRDGDRAQRLRAPSRSRERGAARGATRCRGLYRPQPAARRRVGARPGEAHKAIARRLSISDQTVKFHIAAICSKLGVNNRTGAVRVAIQRGIIAV